MKEQDIRKREAFTKYLELVREDVAEIFDFDAFEESGCFVCETNDLGFEFEKEGFRHESCSQCGTLYVSPRPSFDALRNFYAHAKSGEYWLREFFMPVAEARREKIFRPRAAFVSRLLPASGCAVGDIGSGFGLFPEELRAILPDNRYTVIEPSRDLAELCRQKGLHVLELALEEVRDREATFDFLTAFELIDHLHDPVSFFCHVKELLKPGGQLLFTTTNGQGFDVMLLWEKARIICPPLHLNYFNPKSIAMLLERLGFEEIKVDTPGQLDWEIVESEILNTGVDMGRFWNKIAHDGPETFKSSLQKLISESGLSSHMQVLAKKPL